MFDGSTFCSRAARGDVALSASQVVLDNKQFNIDFFRKYGAGCVPDLGKLLCEMVMSGQRVELTKCRISPGMLVTVAKVIDEETVRSTAMVPVGLGMEAELLAIELDRMNEFKGAERE